MKKQHRPFEDGAVFACRTGSVFRQEIVGQVDSIKVHGALIGFAANAVVLQIPFVDFVCDPVVALRIEGAGAAVGDAGNKVFEMAVGLQNAAGLCAHCSSESTSRVMSGIFTSLRQFVMSLMTLFSSVKWGITAT